MKVLFRGLMFMPTGGVSLDKENPEGWFKAGVVAVGMGSKLISSKLLEEKDYGKMEELTKQVIQTLKGL